VLYLPPRLLPPRLGVSSSSRSGDVLALWACVEAGGVGGASRSSCVESERAGSATRTRTGRGKLHLDTDLGPDVRALA
jgi:hypothetical protein